MSTGMPRPPHEPIFTEPVVLPTLRTPELCKLSLEDLELEVQDELASNSHIKQQVRGSKQVVHQCRWCCTSRC